MEDFRRQFLIETAEKLENLQRNLLDGKEFSAEIKRETLRILHTIKGTAQTFGDDSTGSLAHDLETLIYTNENGRNIVVEGIELLQKSLLGEKIRFSANLHEKFQAINPAQSAANDLPDNLSKIPFEFQSQLSKREKDLINAATNKGKNLAILEIGFETANFAAGLMNFREVLNSSGEIVATFPSAKFNAEGKIGFQFLIVDLENAEKIAAENGASVLWENSKEIPANNLDAVLQRIVRHGKEIAAKLNKQIEIETKTDVKNLSPAELQIVFESLLHLVRNAVDHAVERDGKIQINLKEESNDLHFSVKDDGRGIDLEQVKAKAFEKNLISGDEDSDENSLLKLIFQPEFSTKIEATEISGRGVGLDATKNSIEKSGGKISVETESGKGTTFKIILPRRKS